MNEEQLELILNCLTHYDFLLEVAGLSPDQQHRVEAKEGKRTIIHTLRELEA